MSVRERVCQLTSEQGRRVTHRARGHAVGPHYLDGLELRDLRLQVRTIP